MSVLGGSHARGSLRSLKHIAVEKSELEKIEAYDLLLHGVYPTPKSLENGDTLLGQQWARASNSA